MRGFHCPAYRLDETTVTEAISFTRATLKFSLYCGLVFMVTVSFIPSTGASKTPFETGIWTARRRTAMPGHLATTISTPITDSSSVAPTPGAKANVTQTIAEPPSLGYWLNLGIPYYKCPSQFDEDRCKNLPSAKSTPENSAIWKPDYAMLMERITCVIQKLNCPTDNRSFQIETHLGMMFHVQNKESLPDGHSLHGFHILEKYLDNNSYPEKFLDQTGTKSTIGSRLTRRMGRESYSNRLPYHQRYLHTTESVYTGAPYETTGEQRWSRPRVRRNTHGANSADFLASGSPYSSMTTNSLTEADCYLLPSGGCDKWSSQLVETDQYASSSIEHKVRRRTNHSMNQNELIVQPLNRSTGQMHVRYFDDMLDRPVIANALEKRTKEMIRCRLHNVHQSDLKSHFRLAVSITQNMR
ncbi:unnamed protein product [Echinostoma caproni]|uniref:Uncharacterized protein n=1 Tax=Echinostoma caproni TaxID=27848 RepID=A0A183AFB8_9TREM|nr:unnamed protein product [Echinostoma caproni]